MSSHPHSAHQPFDSVQYRVEAPRAHHAWGSALGAAFGAGVGVPDDMQALLEQLDQASDRQANA